MKKFLILFLIVFISGCSQPPLGAGTLQRELQEKPYLQLKSDNILESKDNGGIIEYSFADTNPIGTTTFDYKEKEKTTRLVENLSKRTDKAQYYEIGDGRTMMKLYSDSTFYKDVNKNESYYILRATTTKEAFDLQVAPNLVTRIKNLFLGSASATNFTDSNTAAICPAENTTWATIRGGSTGFLYNNADAYVYARKFGTAFGICRPYYTYDTSSIPDDNIISAATMNVISDVKGTDDSRSFNIYNSTHTDTPVAGDFDLVDFSTAFATAISFSSWNNAGVNTFNFTSTSNYHINVTGKTKFVIADVTKDAADSAPSVDANTYVHLLTSSDATPGNRPYMTVTYAPAPSTAVPLRNIIFFE